MHPTPMTATWSLIEWAMAASLPGQRSVLIGATLCGCPAAGQARGLPLRDYTPLRRGGSSPEPSGESQELTANSQFIEPASDLEPVQLPAHLARGAWWR